MYRGFVIALMIFGLATNPAFAHSGGTDSRGCHAGSQPYHCHNSKSGLGEYEDALTLIGIICVGLLVVYIMSISMNSMGGSNDFQDLDTLNNGMLLPTYDMENESVGIKYKLNF